MEIITQKPFFDYDAKYALEQTKEVFLLWEPNLQQQLSQSATQIFSALGCKDIARIDFISSQGKLYFLEVNTIPGMTETSFYPQCVLHAWYPSFAIFLDKLIQAKLKR
jgi:D-alanine-D-alanine ligase